jgi:hypothetical protein
MDLSGWGIWLLLGGLIVFVSVSQYLAKDLVTPYKELRRLRDSIAITMIVLYFMIFALPSFYYHSCASVDLANSGETSKVIQKQQECFAEMRTDLHEYSQWVGLSLLAIAVGLLPSIYSFARAITPKPPTDLNPNPDLSIWAKEE